MAADRIAVGRVGRPHGVTGDVSVQIRTDAPQDRFAAGIELGSETGPLLIERVRWHHGRLLVRFAGVASREAAESLRGQVLTIPTDAVGDPGEDAWWDHQLIGLAAVLPDGESLGVVTDVLHLPAQDTLTVQRLDGRELLVPFVGAVVPEVDVAGGRLVVNPPAGLLDL
ncbi:MAG: ribosome maturation factor RimM [Mycobacteriales bacterium]